MDFFKFFINLLPLIKTLQATYFIKHNVTKPTSSNNCALNILFLKNFQVVNSITFNDPKRQNIFQCH